MSELPPLPVTADLHVDVDGVPARVTGDGQRVTVATGHPIRLLASAARTPSSRRSLAAVADALAAGGVTLELTGSHGPVGAVGHDVHSRLGGVVTGTTHVRADVDRRTAFVGAALLAAGVGVFVRLRWRRPVT